MMLTTKIDATANEARALTITTAHGTFETPYFMPVGTRGAVKGLSIFDIEELDFNLILSNTYHLFLRPGSDLIERVSGDLRKYMGHNGPILTDSGGFQVFSLSKLNKITEEGVYFQSPIDGAKHFISPEKSMEIQKELGSDIVMAFDECLALPATKEKVRESLELTLRWAKRCRDFKLREYQNLFGIIQGGLELDMREECLQRLSEYNFDGYAIGGLSVGESGEDRNRVVQFLAPKMPQNKPRYLMGVGTPIDILDAIFMGVDMFDCVMPTRNGRNGQYFTLDGPVNLKNLKFKEDFSLLDENCECKMCRRYSKSYVRHLLLVKEFLAGQILSYHNLHFYRKLVKDARKYILQGEKYFFDFYSKFKYRYLNNQNNK